jgi:tetratricopeptide (TPR) repeat protein
MRSGSERGVEMVPLETQAKLEKSGDLHGLATTFILRGEKDQAADYLSKLASSPDVDSDRAVVALAKGDFEEALRLLEGVLEKAPNHASALWNRGLVLSELRLYLLAAESFGKVAALNEPGWSGEARERKAALERRVPAQPLELVEQQVQQLRAAGQSAHSQNQLALERAFLQEAVLRQAALPGSAPRP